MGELKPEIEKTISKLKVGGTTANEQLAINQLLKSPTSYTNNKLPPASSAADQTTRDRNPATIEGNSSFLSLGKVNFTPSNFKSSNQRNPDLTFPVAILDSDGNLPYVRFDIFEINSNPGAPVTATAQTRSAGSMFAGMGNILQSGQKFVETASAAVQKATAGTDVGKVASEVGGAVSSTVKAAEDKLGFNAEAIKKNISSLFQDFSLNRYYDTPIPNRSICLPMPDGLVTQYSQEYGSISLSSALGPLGFASQALAEPTLLPKNDPYLAELSSTLLKSTLDRAGFQTAEELTNLLQFGMSGRVVNPQMEMLYKSPNFRQFTFDFRLIPRNQQDAVRIQNIINVFKVHSSPTFCGTTTGRYYTPPAKFKFEFKRSNEANNPFLFKSKECVITNIAVDYAPNGYATHADGAPVEIRLSLQLTETSMITSEDFNQDNY